MKRQRMTDEEFIRLYQKSRWTRFLFWTGFRFGGLLERLRGEKW